MRIGIDAKTLSKRYTGIAVYVSEVIRHFTEIDSSDEFFLIFRLSQYCHLFVEKLRPKFPGFEFFIIRVFLEHTQSTPLVDGI